MLGKGKVIETRKVNGNDGGLKEGFNGVLGWGCIVPLDTLVSNVERDWPSVNPYRQ